MASPPSYDCATLPEPQNLTISREGSNVRGLSPGITALQITIDEATSAFDVPTREEILNTSLVEGLPAPVLARTDNGPTDTDGLDGTASPSRARKLCVRHLRMADEDNLGKLQRSLDALPLTDRQIVNGIWQAFSSSSHPRRHIILQGLLHMCCFSQLSFLTDELSQLIRLDPFSVFPKEVSLRVLGHLDAFSLCRAAQVSRLWRQLADDDILWHGICEQHIGHTCRNCGWGLPLLKEKRNNSQSSPTKLLSPGSSNQIRFPSPKRELDNGTGARPTKRQKSVPFETTGSDSPSAERIAASLSVPSNDDKARLLASTMGLTRPWKSVYYERLTIERNWRRGQCTIRTLKGHTDGVMCLQFSENLTYPSFPVLITGSYDRTARVWNMDTGEEIAVLQGHGRAIRALQFDNAKLITGSMDRTLKVWNWRTGACIRTLEGHAEGIVCLNFDSNVLASGSVDATIKIWNFRNGECFTLRGHHDWVNSLQLWDSKPANLPLDDSSDNGQPAIDFGKMLFSASDDGTIKLWDLAERICVRNFTGHVGQVQSIKLCADTRESLEAEGSASPSRDLSPTRDSRSTSPMASTDGTTMPPDKESHHPESVTSRFKLFLVSGSLDNTIKTWDIETGKEIGTLFGHIEGIWAVAVSPLRIVSASHDRTIKIWSRETGQCTATLVGHRSPVTCIAMSDDKIVSGSDDGDIRIWSFST